MKQTLTTIFDKAREKLEYLKDAEISFTVPNNPQFGDYSTNVALTLAKKLRRAPRDIANEIIENLETENTGIEVSIAGAGFINFKFSAEALVKVIPEILSQNKNYGKSNKYNGKKVIVEFVSANPTGPLTVGHGRNAVVGDTVANLLEWIGYDVTREYYFNNAGRQMRVLGDSVWLRYLELFGKKIDFPEDYYQGEYIKNIAKEFKEQNNEFNNTLISYSIKTNNKLLINLKERIKEFAEHKIFDDIKKTLASLGIEMNSFYNENKLYENGKIDEILKIFEEKGVSYKKDGAVWLKLTELGNEQDKVIVKSSGEPTYRLPDIAYHTTKFERGFDLIVDLFGSDHMATYPDVLAGLKFLGYDTSKIKVLIHQFVTIMENGEVVKMSTRKANFVTLDELIEEVGSDVVRYFFIMRSITSHLNFDLTLAKKQSDENPVFYLQYAHARISSILRMTKEEGLASSTENLNLLTTNAEKNLLKLINRFKDEIHYAAENYEPHKVANFLQELAAAFHKFYTECRIIGSEQKLAEARIALAEATQILIRNGLNLLGITAPERM